MHDFQIFNNFSCNLVRYGILSFNELIDIDNLPVNRFVSNYLFDELLTVLNFDDKLKLLLYIKLASLIINDLSSNQIANYISNIKVMLHCSVSEEDILIIKRNYINNKIEFDKVILEDNTSQKNLNYIQSQENIINILFKIIPMHLSLSNSKSRIYCLLWIEIVTNL